ncbi:MAG: magnesium/cobalt transporter CorA [Candidatus Thermoplasmatota archaeon]|nr:magnesium/cobalt transporter CorA [Candidatus Thermoplasmatota archaeon]
MARVFRRKRPHRYGAPPGDVQEEDLAEHIPPTISMFLYDEDHLHEERDISVDQALEMSNQQGTVWINVDGLGDLEVLESLWDAFDVHPLVREDIVNTHQRPKFEEYPDQHFLVLQMVRLVDEELAAEQVSVVFGEGWTLSFQETVGDVFDPVRDRLRGGRPRIRGSGSDYLAYSLLDAVVDGFFPILEVYGEWVEDTEHQALDDPQEQTIEDIHELKRDFLTLRRALWPLREAVNQMQRADGTGLVSDDTRTFLRDAYDHVVRVMDMVETYRELSSSLADVYYSTLSHRMNEVMKVLTIVATIFIPITFVAGLYGMNFEYMPELGYRYSYFIALGVMAAISVGMLIMFRRREWL